MLYVQLKNPDSYSVLFDMMTARNASFVAALLQNKNNVCKESSAVAMEKLNFDSKAISINLHAASCWEAWLFTIWKIYLKF